MRKLPGIAIVVTVLLLPGCADGGLTEADKKRVPPVPSTTKTTQPAPAPPPADRAPTTIWRVEVPDGQGSTVGVLSASVTRVIDGDTAEMRLEDGRAEKVRFIGVDTPESTTKTEPYGPEASAYTKEALAGRKVYLELDVEERDRYGRLLAYVWLTKPTRGDENEVREKMFNARLLTDGYAQIMTIPPNVKYVDLLKQIQAEARDGNRGLWGLPVGEPATTTQTKGNCDPSYPDVCIPPPPPDLDCKDVPYRRFKVLPPDPHRLDGNHDGVGCEG